MPEGKNPAEDPASAETYPHHLLQAVPIETAVALTALEQVGLIAAVERGGAKFWELVPTAGKKNLADAPILKCLEE